jgi:hypothetical protein
MSPSTDTHSGGALIPEIERYLRIVEFFRSEGCEPHWAREDASPVEAAPEMREAPGLRS